MKNWLVVTTRVAVGVVCASVLVGCEILSLRSYPENTLEINPEFPIGKFVTLENDFLTFSKEGGQIGFVMHDENDPNEMGVLKVYKLENFRGFCLEPVPLESDALNSIKALNPDLPEQVNQDIHSLHTLWRFGMFEIYDDAIILFIPHQPAFSRLVREMGIASFKVDIDSMYTTTVLAITSEELVEVMDRALPTNMFIPMVLAPAEIAENWDQDTEMDDMRAKVRARYPKLIDRLEEIERATDPSRNSP